MAHGVCEECEYYEVVGPYPVEGILAECRRYPPIHIGPERSEFGYLHTNPNGWCGEFKSGGGG